MNTYTITVTHDANDAGAYTTVETTTNVAETPADTRRALIFTDTPDEVLDDVLDAIRTHLTYLRDLRDNAIL
jgi:hypothetical protein